MVTKLLTLLLCVISLMAVAEVYRSVDAKGNVTYSDTPSRNAEKVKLPKIMVYSPAPTPRREDKPEPIQEPPYYQKMSITKPKRDETIWDNQGIVEMVLALEPDLKVSRGHRVLVTVNGEPHGEPRVTTRIHIADLDRGTHRIATQVVDMRGEVLIAASPVTIHLHRQSILFPNRQGGRPTPLPRVTP
jgi:hypothetical protein